MGAMLKCSCGVAPGTLMVLPISRVLTAVPDANIMDNKPMLNILPFGMCQSIMNPMVMVATIAAMGTLTPMPCVPMTFVPWLPGAPTVLLGNMPALNNSSKLLCLWGGMIAINAPGQFTAAVP